MFNEKICEHISDLEEIKQTQTHQCAECIKAGEGWLQLRVCQACGVTLCCDDSPNRHMTAHYAETGHSVIASGEKGERWLWCFKDQVFAEY